METKLAKYEISAVLARSSLSTVYEGWDTGIERRVALKAVQLPDARDQEGLESLARFRREAQAAGRLQHPNIVAIYDYGETAEVAYIAMEFIDGRSLAAVLDSKEPLSVPTMMGIMEDVLAGLEYSHARGVVHRDIKPANIMITREGRAKIADFGIARIESSSMTQVGTVIGTPAYMSPEQLSGDGADARSDIYSLGVVLYQMLAGKRPFEGGLATITYRALNTEPPRPSQVSVKSPPTFDRIVATAMAKAPEKRFPTVNAFADALRNAYESTVVIPPRPVRKPAPQPREPEPAREPDPVHKLEPTGDRDPFGAFVGGLDVSLAKVAGAAAVAVIGGAGLWFLLSGPATPPVAGVPAPADAPTAYAPPADARPAYTPVVTAPPGPVRDALRSTDAPDDRLVVPPSAPPARAEPAAARPVPPAPVPSPPVQSLAQDGPAGKPAQVPVSSGVAEGVAPAPARQPDRPPYEPAAPDPQLSPAPAPRNPAVAMPDPARKPPPPVSRPATKPQPAPPQKDATTALHDLRSGPGQPDTPAAAPDVSASAREPATAPAPAAAANNNAFGYFTTDAKGRRVFSPVQPAPTPARAAEPEPARPLPVAQPRHDPAGTAPSRTAAGETPRIAAGDTPRSAASDTPRTPTSDAPRAIPDENVLGYYRLDANGRREYVPR